MMVGGVEVADQRPGELFAQGFSHHRLATTTTHKDYLNWECAAFHK